MESEDEIQFTVKIDDDVLETFDKTDDLGKYRYENYIRNHKKYL